MTSPRHPSLARIYGRTEKTSGNALYVDEQLYSLRKENFDSSFYIVAAIQLPTHSLNNIRHDIKWQCREISCSKKLINPTPAHTQQSSGIVR